MTVDWTITDRERAAFAVLSGDHNPIHTDPVAARRLQGGRMLVHGAHLLLGVLDQAIEQRRLTAPPRSIDVRFRHGVVAGMPLTTTFADQRVDIDHVSHIDHVDDFPGELKIRVTADVWTAVDVAIVTGEQTVVEQAPLAAPWSPFSAATAPSSARFGHPDDVAFDDLPGRTGDFEVAAPHKRFVSLFPHSTALLGVVMVAEIAQISRVVGMHAPGMRSMSSRYRITSFRAGTPTASTASTGMRYSVRSTDRRLRKVDVDVDGTAMSARVEAFSPTGPVDQVTELDGASRPESSEFADQRALVVGGSRGLGAATVLLLADGGADVRFTYRVGVTEADAISRTAGARAVRFDTREGSSALEAALGDGWQPTHLYWLATPPYRDGAFGAYSTRFRDELLAVQVDAFAELVDHLAGSGLRVVLWPSCEAVHSANPAAAELTEVKLRGATTVRDLRSRHSSLTVVMPAWPILLTDQTTALLPTEYADTSSTLLATLRTL